MHEQLNFAIEILGTISFSMSGSFAAMQKRLDPFGVLIIAFVTSVGGGTVRDLLLDIPVFWMHDLLMCGLIWQQVFSQWSLNRSRKTSKSRYFFSTVSDWDCLR